MAVEKLEPTVTIGGAPAGYQPLTTLQSTATFGGAPAAYEQVATPNAITGANIPAAASTPGSFRAAEEKSNAPFYAANPDYVAKMMEKPADSYVAPPSDWSTGQDGELLFKGQPFTGVYNGKTYKNGVLVTTDTVKKDTTLSAVPTGPTLAKDVFKQTLAIYFGQAETTKPWMDELYNLSAPLYKSGATMEEALNMALMQGRNNPLLADFTKRFSGIYALQDKKVAGAAVNVPTIAEYYAAEAGMGAVLRQANLGDLANETFLSGVIGKGLSVTDVGNYINNIYTEIQNLPADIKEQVGLHYPAMDNVSLAKAVLTGDKGFAQLQQDLTTYEIQAAGTKQGVGLNDTQARNLAGQGYTLNTAMTGLGQVALAAPTYQKLQEISGNAPVAMTQAQQDLIDANMGKTASQQRKIQQQIDLENARFSGTSGAAKGAFSTGYLSKQSNAGLF